MKPFSVVTSVYKNDNPSYVRIALDSILVNQSIIPSEVILVQDGPIPKQLEEILSEYEYRYPEIMHIIRLNKNQGLGNALKLGVENSQYEIIARMDSDDISLPYRFEKQLTFLEKYPDTDIVGGQMSEFIDFPDNIIGIREVPLDNKRIYTYMKSRCALNHVTVMFKKSSILEVGNYQDWYCNEDYYLWIRMMEANCVFANIPEILVNVRSGTEQYSRRGGRKYYESEKSIKKLQLRKKMITRVEYYLYVFERYVIQILMPNSIRGWIFRKFARS